MKQEYWGYQPQRASVEWMQGELPLLGETDVLVANRAIGINPVDWKFIKANPLHWPLGHVPGVDGSGVIVALGSKLDASLIGKRVAYHAFLKADGSFARFTRISAPRLMFMPDGMSFSQAAALPCPMLTAWLAYQKIPKTANPRVLVVGFGAVNAILAQLLVQAGYQVDVVSASLEASLANTLGIKRLYRHQRELKAGYFAIFDAISGSNAASLVPLLKANGHIICIQDRIPAPIDPAFSRTISYHELALGALHEFGDSEDWRALMTEGQALLADIQRGSIRTAEPMMFDFTELPKALAHSERHKTKAVVRLEHLGY